MFNDVLDAFPELAVYHCTSAKTLKNFEDGFVKILTNRANVLNVEENYSTEKLLGTFVNHEIIDLTSTSAVTFGKGLLRKRQKLKKRKLKHM